MREGRAPASAWQDSEASQAPSSAAVESPAQFWEPLRTWSWPRTTSERLLAGALALLLLGLGALMSGLAFEDHRTAVALQRRGVATTGTITAVDDRRDVTVTVVFRTAAGRRVQESGVAVGGPVVVGRAVPVVYDRQDPTDFLVEEDAGRGSSSAAGDAVVAVPLLLVGSWQLVRTVHRRARRT